jgi:hypothetical protein
MKTRHGDFIVHLTQDMHMSFVKISFCLIQTLICLSRHFVITIFFGRSRWLRDNESRLYSEYGGVYLNIHSKIYLKNLLWHLKDKSLNSSAWNIILIGFYLDCSNNGSAQLAIFERDQVITQKSSTRVLIHPYN